MTVGIRYLSIFGTYHGRSVPDGFFAYGGSEYCDGLVSVDMFGSVEVVTDYQPLQLVEKGFQILVLKSGLSADDFRTFILCYIHTHDDSTSQRHLRSEL